MPRFIRWFERANSITSAKNGKLANRNSLSRFASLTPVLSINWKLQKFHSYVGNEVRPPRRRSGAENSRVSTPRFEDSVSNFSRLVTDRKAESALIATIGWLKTHYPSFRIVDPVSKHIPPRARRSPKTFLLRPEERVFGSVGNTIASDAMDQTARSGITRLPTYLNNNLRRYAERESFFINS